jgi:DUF1680 family protein
VLLGMIGLRVSPIQSSDDSQSLWYGIPLRLMSVCCCPPNLSRTLGMLGGYTWATKLDTSKKIIELNVYLLLSATRTIPLPNGEEATVEMISEMPFNGNTTFNLSAPGEWKWVVRLPSPEYATDIIISESTTDDNGFLAVQLPATGSINMKFDLPIQLLSSHPLTGQDNLTIRRGPIVYVAESIDNPLESTYPHFAGLGIKSSSIPHMGMEKITIENLEVVAITVPEVYAVQSSGEAAFELVSSKSPARKWVKVEDGLKLVPWFARANRGGEGHVRASLLRADEDA